MMTPEDHARVLEAMVACYGQHRMTPEDVDACEAGAKALRMQEWQPIETAPKDGTRLLFWNGHRRTLAWYAVYGDGSQGWHRQNLIGEVLGLATDLVDDTHWMPLPDPPVEAR